MEASSALARRGRTNREELADTRVAEPEAGPEDDANKDGDQAAGDRLATAEIDCGGPAEIGGHQDGASKGCSRDQIERDAGYLDEGEMMNVVRREEWRWRPGRRSIGELHDGS